MRNYYDLSSEEGKVKEEQSAGNSGNLSQVNKAEFIQTVNVLNERLPRRFEPWIQTREVGSCVTIERYLIKVAGMRLCFLLPHTVRNGLFFFLEKPRYLNGDEISSFNNWRSERKYPNYIKTPKPSKRQLTEWIDYIKEEEWLFTQHVDKCRKEKADFLKSIEGYEVDWNANNTSGEIEKNGINFSFTFDKGEIFTKIKLAYNVGTSLESFKGLSNNNWTKL